MSGDPFHEGERLVQERTGERDAALRNAPVLGGVIPSRAVDFIAQQRMLAVGSADGAGAVWASLLFGARGFVTSDDGGSVIIDRARINVDHDDVVWSNLRTGVNVGLLAIELESRRRLRINGVVNACDDSRIEVVVREAYPNCPKYIQRRHAYELASSRNGERSRAEGGTALDDDRSQLIERADTFFVASRHPGRGVDVSHRGGARGFVRVLAADRLRIPDYRGNSMFNTLGNLMIDAHAGLIFLDFERARLLQLTGTATVDLEGGEDAAQPSGGTGRYWDFQIAHWVERVAPTHLAWEYLDASPHNPSGRT